MKCIVITLLAIATSDDASACQCIQRKFDKAVDKSKYIFHGRVISSYPDTFEVEIIETWKGGYQGDTLTLYQGRGDCERGGFELNEEYLFYLSGTRVSNCSRTEIYSLTLDPDLLDLKLRNIGIEDSILFVGLTDRQVEYLEHALKSRNIEIPNDIRNRELRFAIEGVWVNKLTYLSAALHWTDLKICVTTMKGTSALIFWTGYKWEKSLKRLKRRAQS